MIPDATDFVFISDRANSISSALEDVYPLTHRGICMIHLLRNITPTYLKIGLLPLIENAVDAYTYHEFWSIFKDIKDECQALAKYQFTKLQGQFYENLQNLFWSFFSLGDYFCENKLKSFI